MEDNKSIEKIKLPNPQDPDLVDALFILLAAAGAVGTAPVLSVIAVIFGGIQYFARRSHSVSDMLYEKMQNDLERQKRLTAGTTAMKYLLPPHAVIIEGQVVRAISEPIPGESHEGRSIVDMFADAGAIRDGKVKATSEPVNTEAPVAKPQKALPSGPVILEAEPDDDISEDEELDLTEEVASFIPKARKEHGVIYITVGLNPQGQPVYMPVKHGIVAVSTGGGKTNTLDLIVGQLRAMGVNVWYGSPKYVPVDHESDPPLDRSPIYEGIPSRQFAVNKDEIAPWISRAADEVVSRYGKMQKDKTYKPEPMVIVLDELKAYLKLIARTKDADGKTPLTDTVNSKIQTVLTLGRECKVFLIFSSQDGYCGSIEMTRGEIGNLGFRLVHPSLDSNSKNNLLPEGARLPMIPGEYQWFCAVGQKVEAVTVVRVSVKMMVVWGLVDEKAERARRRREVLRQYHLGAVQKYGDADLLATLLDDGISGSAQNLVLERPEPREPAEPVLAKTPGFAHISAREVASKLGPEADIYPTQYSQDELFAIIRYASVQHGQSRTRIARRIRVAKAVAHELVNQALGPDTGSVQASAA